MQAHRRLDFFEYVWWRLFGISSSILFSMGYLLLRIVTLLWIVPRITKRVNEVNEHGESCQLHLCCQSFRNGRDDHERKNEKNGALVVGCNTKKSITAKTGSILGKLSPFPFSFSSSTCMVHEPRKQRGPTKGQVTRCSSKRSFLACCIPKARHFPFSNTYSGKPCRWFRLYR